MLIGLIGAAAITDRESWVTDSEFILSDKPHAKEADGSRFAARAALVAAEQAGHIERSLELCAARSIRRRWSALARLVSLVGVEFPLTLVPGDMSWSRLLKPNSLPRKFVKPIC